LLLLYDSLDINGWQLYLERRLCLLRHHLICLQSIACNIDMRHLIQHAPQHLPIQAHIINDQHMQTREIGLQVAAGHAADATGWTEWRGA
jgi:hypothetical protein